MRYSQIINEARRVSPDAFYELAKAKYGETAALSLTREQVKLLAAENDMLVPTFISGQKVSRGKFSVRPPGYVDKAAPQVKTQSSPTKDEHKSLSAKTACVEIFSALKNSREGRSISSTHPPEDIGGGRWMAEVRDWGNWENPQEAYDEDDYEDYDWQVLSRDSKAALNAIVAKYQAIYGRMDILVSAEEKNWISIQVVGK